MNLRRRKLTSLAATRGEQTSVLRDGETRRQGLHLVHTEIDEEAARSYTAWRSRARR